MTLTFGSLFSGIGGIDLGLERAGMRCVWQSEIDPYASAVLKKHWPEVPNLGDIKRIESAPAVDLICGGVPCQPWSVAGRQTRDTDDRDLWPEMFRLVRLLRPRFVLVEEVPGFAVSVGIGRTLGDLACEGFNAEWSTIRASDAGAPHERERLYVVAYSMQQGLPGHLAWPRFSEPTPATQPERCDAMAGAWQGLALDSPALPVADGIPVAVARRMLKPVGNAVVPQVAEAIGRMILDAINTAPPQGARGDTGGTM